MGDFIRYFIDEMTCTMVNMMKYVPGSQGVDEAVSIKPRYLTFVLDQAVCRRPWGLKPVSDDSKDQGICEWVVNKNQDAGICSKSFQIPRNGQ